MKRENMIAKLTVAAAVGALLVPLSAPARDTTGLSQTLSAEMNEWVRGLHSPGGAWCCDEADGIDPVWETTGDGYRVKFQGEWLTVQPTALITAPNRLGVARAWIGFTADTKPYVRCFLPGPTT
jgi:hypothetical protein